MDAIEKPPSPGHGAGGIGDEQCEGKGTARRAGATATESLLREYLAAGFALVPIGPDKDGCIAKGPHGNGWNLRGACITTNDGLRRIKPGWNVGLAHAYSGTCALDIDNLAAARPWLGEGGVDIDALRAERFAVQITSGRENRAKLLYRLPAGVASLPTRKLDEHGLEFRCATANGRTVQDVLPPSVHPDTGRPYCWLYNDDVLAHFSLLPEVPPPLLALWRSLVAREERAPPPQSDATVDLHALATALSVCREEAANYEDWYRYGIAIYRATAGSAEGFALWVRWSTLAPEKFAKTRNLQAKWKSFAGEHTAPVTAATIFARARELAPAAAPTAFGHPIAQTVPSTGTVRSGDDLMRMEFAELRWCVPDLLPEGCYLLAARPKIGKSWLALGIALAVATGQPYLDRQIDQGPALYLGLEDNDRRLKSRLLTLTGFETPSLADFHYDTRWPRIDEGGVEQLKEWLRAHPGTRLVVIDTLARIRARATRRDGGNSYEDDYAAGQAIKSIADGFGLTVLLVTHTRKSEAADPLDLVTGTLGLAGAVDGALVLERIRGKDAAIMHVIGRDIEREGEWGLSFGSGRWSLVGGAAEVRRSHERQQIIDALLKGGPQSAKDVAEAVGRKREAVRKLLREMALAGEVQQDSRGHYHAEHSLL